MSDSIQCARSSAPLANARALALAIALALALPLVTAASASANPSKVEELLRKAGNAGVARGPKTIDDAAKATIDGYTKALANKTGGKAYVVVLPGDAAPADYVGIYGSMGLGGKDVLIATNGKQWELRCDGIDAGAKANLLQKALGSGGNPVQRLEKLMNGLPSALAGSQRANAAGRTVATTQGRPFQPSSSDSGGFPWGWALFGVLIAGVVGIVVMRRRQRDGRLAAEFKKALEPGESAMAEIFLGMDGLESHPRFDELLSKATALSSRLDELKAGPPSRQSIVQAEQLGRQARELHGQFRAIGGSASAQLEGF